MVNIAFSQRREVQILVDALHAMVPEEHDLAFSDRLGSGEHQLDYIVKMPKSVRILGTTYLLLCGTRLGLISSILNHAKYSSHGATL